MLLLGAIAYVVTLDTSTMLFPTRALFCMVHNGDLLKACSSF